MWDMREAKNNSEARFGQLFLKLDTEELRMLNGTCHDETFREKHPKLVGYIYKALMYRENQLNTNCEDACSIQDLFIEEWNLEELANGIVGLERIRVLAGNFPKIIEYIHMFDRLLVTRCLGIWLGMKDSLDAS
ncbi:MAG: hypothetical protein K0U90_08445 [Planctomycetes bacterium]|nr:hypothetical protein [Planctomycetota bacterium]